MLCIFGLQAIFLMWVAKQTYEEQTEPRDMLHIWTEEQTNLLTT